MAFELLPAGHSPFLQFLAAADDIKVTAFLAHPDRQRQSPEPLLGDHPVAHVPEPVQLPGPAVDRLRQERDVPVLDHLHDLRSKDHTSELQSLTNLVCRLLLEKKKKPNKA